MIEFGGDIELRGPFEEYPRTVRAGAWVLFIGADLLGLVLPVCVAALVFTGTGTAGVSCWGIALSIGMLAAFMTVCAWAVCRLLYWMRGENLRFRSVLMFVACGIGASTAIALLALKFKLLSLLSFALFPLSFFLMLIGAVVIQFGLGASKRHHLKRKW